MCERLVLVGSGGLGREVSWMLRALTLPGAEYVMPVLFPRFARTAGERVVAFFRDRGVRAPQIAEMWSAYASLTETENRHAFVRTVRAVIDPGGQTVSAKDRLYLAAAVPTLIAWGDRDNIVPVAHAYATHALLPDSQLEIFERAGHFLHVEQPARFAEVLHDFIARTKPAERDLGTYREMLRAGAA
jgi:pimeloyl-ACP methyl ester carboxylesterase